MEEIELADWRVTPQTSNSERKQASIEAYWLDRWILKVVNLTFPTQLYYNLEDIPEVLKYPVMVRWENKSPKDSPHWGPVQTRWEIKRLFETSLRCQTNQGKIYCLREWVSLIPNSEFRIFWNGAPTAISGDMEPEESLIQYLAEIAPRIPYYRCVLDVARKESDGSYILIEFNSWETNSGAHLFEWTEDCLYQTQGQIQSRWLCFDPRSDQSTIQNKILQWPLNSSELSRTNRLPTIIGHKEIRIDQIKPLYPKEASSWLIIEDQLFVTNDVWMASFNLPLTQKSVARRWRRGPFRFTNISEYQGKIITDEKAYWLDLTPAPRPKSIPFETQKSSSYPNLPFKYGFMAMYEDRYVFARFLYDGTFALVYV